jgi:transcriptional regulator with XRE-family HTH domain
MHWQGAKLLTMSMPGVVATNLGRNIQNLRQARGLSQQQMARVAHIPRATWANLESGESNPTLSVLVNVAQALQVRLEELIEPPRRTGRLYPAASLPVRKRGEVTVRKLLPETIAGLEIERMELPAGAAMSGVPHTPGTREYLTCERGHIELTAAGERFALTAGDVVVFRGDERHGYRNLGDGTAIAYSVIAFAPVSS